MKKMDLTGKRFGSLTVLGEHPEPYRDKKGIPSRRWICRCDCGKETIVVQNSLTSGNTSSCGCGARKYKDLTGQRFGKLTALREESYQSPGGKISRKWICRCDCGKEVSVLQNNLLKGATQSCGCLRSTPDLRGQRFGHLTVISDTFYTEGAKRSRAQCMCRCDCGVVKAIDIGNLDHIVSCGCKVREGAEKRIVEDNVFKFYDGTAITALSKKVAKNNTSGVKGVSKVRGKWQASIMLRRKTINLGMYDTLEEAKAARLAGEEKYFKPVMEEFSLEKHSD